jgi:hypothetical protein
LDEGNHDVQGESIQNPDLESQRKDNAAVGYLSVVEASEGEIIGRERIVAQGVRVRVDVGEEGQRVRVEPVGERTGEVGGQRLLRPVGRELRVERELAAPEAQRWRELEPELSTPREPRVLDGGYLALRPFRQREERGEERQARESER